MIQTSCLFMMIVTVKFYNHFMNKWYIELQQTFGLQTNLSRQGQVHGFIRLETQECDTMYQKLIVKNPSL